MIGEPHQDWTEASKIGRERISGICVTEEAVQLVSHRWKQNKGVLLEW
jgi:hypothetical protein